MHRSLLVSIEHQANGQPEAPALVWRRETITYRQFFALAEQARAQICALGLGENPTLGVLAAKSPWAVATVLGCLMARCRVLLPPVDLAPETLRTLFDRAGCQRVLAVGSDRTASLGPAAQLADHVVVPGAGVPGGSWTGPSSADDVGFMLATSGSTGPPKIVPLTVGAVDRFVGWAGAAFDLGPGRAVLNYAPLNFDLCLLDIWATLAHGGCVVLVDPDRATDARHLIDLIDANRIHLVQAVPMLYRLLVDATVTTGRPLPSVRHAIFTGDHLPARCLAELPRLVPQARLYNLYGCTETNDSFLYEVDDVATTPVPMPLGEPLPGVESLVVDAAGRVLTGPGTGELYVHTPFQTTGYLDAALNTAKFVPHPEGADDRRYFRSGDLVRQHADGTRTLEGRNDHQIKVRGIRVNTQDVEQALLAHEHVVEAAVLAVADATAGHRLHAVVRRRSAYPLNTLTLRRHCAERLPRTALPAVIDIVDQPLPRTATGKVDRAGLAGAHARTESKPTESKPKER